MAYRVEGYIFFVDNDNYAGNIAFSVLTMLLVAWLFIATRFWQSLWYQDDDNAWHRDDSMLVLSTVLASAAYVCASIAAWYGLGDDPKNYNHSQLVTQNKSMMAMHTLYVVSVGLNKTSYLLISLRVLGETITDAYRNALRIFAAFIWVWTILAGVAGLTGCPISGESRTCFAEGRFSVPVAMVDCILEVVCILVPITLVWKSQMRKPLKGQWYFIFGLRSIIVTVIMWRTDCMVALMQPNISDKDWSSRKSQATIAMLVEMSFGISSVTIPFIHPLILGLPSEPNIVGPDPVFIGDDKDSESEFRALKVSLSGLQSSAKLVPRNITNPEHKRINTLSAPYPSPASSTNRSMTSLAARSSVSIRESARNSAEFYAAVYL